MPLPFNLAAKPLGAAIIAASITAGAVSYGTNYLDIPTFEETLAVGWQAQKDPKAQASLHKSYIVAREYLFLANDKGMAMFPFRNQIYVRKDRPVPFLNTAVLFDRCSAPLMNGYIADIKDVGRHEPLETQVKKLDGINRQFIEVIDPCMRKGLGLQFVSGLFLVLGAFWAGVEAYQAVNKRFTPN